MQAIQLPRGANGNVNKPLVARLKTVMIKKGLNPKTLAEKANVGRSFVYDILNGKSANPTSSKLTAIAEQLGVSVQYLLSGVHTSGSAEQSPEIAEISSLVVEATPDGNIVVTPLNKGQVHYFENKWIKDNLNASSNNIRAIKIAGDSMFPTLQEKDVVLVDITQTSPTPPGLFLLFDGLGLHAKRLELKNKEIINVISDNSQYLNYEMSVAEINIVGKIVWLGREL